MFIGREAELKFLEDKYRQKKWTVDRSVWSQTCWKNGDTSAVL